MQPIVKVITSDDNAKLAASKWKDKYYTELGHGKWYDEKKERIYQQLVALENPTKEQVDSIIGNYTWTKIYCVLTTDMVDKAVVWGDESDYLTFSEKALEMMNEALKQAN